MKRIVIGLCLVGVLGLASSAFAQTAQVGATSASMGSVGALAYLEIQAGSIDRDTQLAALNEVRRIIASGPLSATVKPSVYRTLSELAYSGTIDPTITGMTVVNSYPDIRMAACQLLGRIGGTKASSTLLRVVSNDPDTTVLSQAIFELGSLGHNTNNTVSQAIVWAFDRQDALSHDDNLAFASLLALGKIARTNRGITDPSVFDMIARIQAENYSGPVKNEATRLLGEIQRLG